MYGLNKERRSIDREQYLVFRGGEKGVLKGNKPSSNQRSSLEGGVKG